MSSISATARAHIFALSLFSLFATERAAASVIYDNGPPDQVTLFEADASSQFTAEAESFVLNAGANTISGVNWWGGCVTADRQPTACPTGDFTLGIYDSTLSTLNASYTVGAANQTATGQLVFGATPEYSYSASIPNLTLTAGSTYWLSISNSTTADFIWGWETTSTGHVNFFESFNSDTQDWQLGEIETALAFNLTGPDVSSVPEPLTLSLFGAGLAGAVAMRRRKKKTTRFEEN